MRIRYIVVMGVAGCGKSTIAERVAACLDWPFIEGDALHPAANVEKMSRGIPLDDADRMPWLEAVAQTIQRWRCENRPGVIACSALRRVYRDVLADGHDDVCFVYLRGARDLIAKRLATRRGHFMPVGLLDSQFATLEEPVVPPERAIALDVTDSPEELTHRVLNAVVGSTDT